MRDRLVRLLWLAPTVLSIAYFAFWACAPAAYLDPPLAANGPRAVIGAAGVYSDRAVVGNSESAYGRSNGGDGQMWFQRRFKSVGFSVQAAVGQTALLSGGGTFRIHVLDQPRFRMASELHAGGVYFGAALPMVANLTSDLEWYVAPMASMRSGNVLRLPMGLRYAFPDGPVLSLETGAAGLRDSGDVDQLELWGSLGIGFPLLRH